MCCRQKVADNNLTFHTDHVSWSFTKGDQNEASSIIFKVKKKKENDHCYIIYYYIDLQQAKT